MLTSISTSGVQHTKGILWVTGHDDKPTAVAQLAWKVGHACVCREEPGTRLLHQVLKRVGAHAKAWLGSLLRWHKIAVERYTVRIHLQAHK